MHLASSDIKTAFDEAKPKHVAKILDGHDTHGWVIAALLHQVWELSGSATSESVWNPHECGNKWPLRFWSVWRRTG